MRATVCALAAAISLFAHPAFAQSDRAAAAFWRKVRTTCDATAAKPPGELGKRIAQSAIAEFNNFGGHQIDSNGRLFHFGLTEAEHEEDDGGARQATVGHLGWWQVLKYWRSLYGDRTGDYLEAIGYRDASAATQEAEAATLVRTSAARLLSLADSVTDPDEKREFQDLERSFSTLADNEQWLSDNHDKTVHARERRSEAPVAPLLG